MRNLKRQWEEKGEDEGNEHEETRQEDVSWNVMDLCRYNCDL